NGLLITPTWLTSYQSCAGDVGLRLYRSERRHARRGVDAPEPSKVRRLADAQDGESIGGLFDLADEIYNGGEKGKVMLAKRKDDGAEIVIKVRVKQPNKGTDRNWRAIMAQVHRLGGTRHVLGISEIIEEGSRGGAWERAGHGAALWRPEVVPVVLVTLAVLCAVLSHEPPIDLTTACGANGILGAPGGFFVTCIAIRAFPRLGVQD
ncbi:unnamed protein product, partial [Prorocentrum cordatum]